MKSARIWIAAMTAALLTVTATACSPEEDSGTDGIIRVFAASSLHRVFMLVELDFEELYPDLGIVLNFAGSSTLAAQINEGAPADVFASAAPANMNTVVEAGNASDPETFAHNELVIAVIKGNPLEITDVHDLAERDLKVAVCAEEVPCGAAAQTALDASGVELTPVTYETDVKSTLANLAIGEVDAALVYASDVHAARGGIDAVEFPAGATTVNEYQIAVITDCQNPAMAEAFIEYLRSDEGQAILAAERFGTV